MPSLYKKFIDKAKGFSSAGINSRAGIVSHHLLAGREIAGFFSLLKKERPVIKTFFLMGPNHFSRGKSLVSISGRKFKTPFGILMSDTGKAGTLSRAQKNFSVDEKAFRQEHSIGAVIPFIKHYYPRSKIVAIVINYRLTWREAQSLGKAIAGTAGNNDFLLLSADFVHGKEKGKAWTIDSISEDILKYPSRNVSVQGAGAVETDCRKGLLALFAFLKIKGFPKSKIIYHTNSGEITGLHGHVTSYFFVLYGK